MSRLGIDAGRRTVEYGGREVAMRIDEAVDPLRLDARDLDRFPLVRDLGELVGALVAQILCASSCSVDANVVSVFEYDRAAVAEELQALVSGGIA